MGSDYKEGLAHSEKAQESPQTLDNHQLTVSWDSGMVRALLHHRVLPCMRQDGDSGPDLTSPAHLKHSLPKHCQPSLVLPCWRCTPTHGSALWDPTSALASLLALDANSLSRARSTRLCLQEKPLPETQREFSRRMMLMRTPFGS